MSFRFLSRYARVRPLWSVLAPSSLKCALSAADRYDRPIIKLNTTRRRLIVKYRAKQKVIIEKAEDYWVYSGNEDDHVITRLRKIKQRIKFLQSEIV